MILLKILAQPSVRLNVLEQEIRLNVKEAVVVSTQDPVDVYTGDYEVTPAVTAQSLSTKDKLLKEDVKIKEIPYFDVGNTSGGSTIYIGSLSELVGTTAILGTAKLGTMKL